MLMENRGINSTQEKFTIEMQPLLSFYLVLSVTLNYVIVLEEKNTYESVLKIIHAVYYAYVHDFNDVSFNDI